MNARAIAAILSLLLVCAVEAAEKHRVKVTFDIAANHPYLDVYSTPESIAAIHDALLRTLVERLSSEIGFVELTTADAPNHLSFTLEDRVSGQPAGLREVGLRVRFTAANGASPQGDVFWTFRERGHAKDPITPRASFISGLQMVIQNGDINEIVERKLCVLVIASNALPVPKEATFIMPFKREALRIGNGTIFNISTNLDRPSTIVAHQYHATASGTGKPELEEPYRNSLSADVKDEKEKSEFRMFRPGAVRTTGVSIGYYVPIR
jgi:hypothetical protein